MTGLYSGLPGLYGGVGLSQQVGLWSGATGLQDGTGGAPATAILDRAASPILDRAGAYILTRT